MTRRISTRQPNQIASQPTTTQDCASDHRSSGEQLRAEGAARDQLAFTRIAARGDATESDDS
ncbi:hypothetical protein [Streptomyces sp. NPDC005799]|uniref:hypothetical protein n=1 Tax=Streptomyces sp. NPDC005799 TaxID=3154678 RepID=UPI0033DEF91D